MTNNLREYLMVLWDRGYSFAQSIAKAAKELDVDIDNRQAYAWRRVWLIENTTTEEQRFERRTKEEWPEIVSVLREDIPDLAKCRKLYCNAEALSFWQRRYPSQQNIEPQQGIDITEDPELYEAVVALRAMGTSPGEISRTLGVSPSKISRQLTKAYAAGRLVSPLEAKRTRLASLRAAVEKDYAAGMTLNHLAKKYNFGWTTLKNLFNEQPTAEASTRVESMACERNPKEASMPQVEDIDLDDSLIAKSKQCQKLADSNRLLRKEHRLNYRRINALEELDRQVIDILSQYAIGDIQPPVFMPASNEERTAIIQLSDIHFNELIHTDSNQYSFEIASKRLACYADKVKLMLSCFDIKHILIAMTGDLLNSDRRLDEVMNAATNRTRAMVLGADLISKFIGDILASFNCTVSVASVCGNESRSKDEMTFSREGASDNYDSAIYFFLKGLFKDTPRISFLDATNPNEMLVNIYGMHILLTHGASISDNVERSVAQVQGKWAAIGHRVDYVLFGHIHAARIGDTHARSGSLCGSNSYNEERLNLRGRASQNMFIVSPGSIEGIRLDLQVIDYPRQYQFDPDLATYNPKSHDKATATTEVVRIVI